MQPQPSFRRRGACACLVLAIVALAGCSGVVASPAPPGVGAIVVLPVDNRTGSDLYADAPPLVGILRDTPDQRTTAADILTAALQRHLAGRGFAIVGPAALAGGPDAGPVRSAEEAARRLVAAGIDSPALYVRLWIWDAAAPSHVLFVDVKLDATLVAPDGRVLGQARFPATPVDAGGASSVALAYPQVARRVAAVTVDDLIPGRHDGP